MNELEKEFKRVFCQCDSGEDATLKNVEQLPIETLSSLLFRLVMFKSFPLLKHFVELGADVNVNDRGVSLLQYVCQEGELEMAQLLVKSGANVFALCNNGFSILIYAVRSQSLPMIKWTLDLGCCINQKDVRGLTVLHSCVATLNNTENKEAKICTILEFLLSEGALISTIPISPMAIAQENGFLDAAKLLHQHMPATFFDPTETLLRHGGIAKNIMSH